MNDPIAFFLTWTTYGTWLPGDDRGWVDYHHGLQLPDSIKRFESKVQMSEDACVLSPMQREVVERQVLETCQRRHWTLYAVNCRTNHLHVIVGALGTSPIKIRADIKAWCTRRLRASEPARKHWWTERGSQRYIYDEEGLAKVIEYVTEAQDRKHLDAR